MWESPVNLSFFDDFISNMVKQQTEETENYVMEYIRKIGIDVDKEELLKALQYDREQYKKGYQDGLNADRWISVSERLPEKIQDVLIAFCDCPDEYDVAYLRTTFNEIYKKNGAKHEWVSAMGKTTYADYEVDAWMPIEPYKAESEV